ncbi:MAG: hypothetical protein WCG85_05460 [Polyangia bacterium]
MTTAFATSSARNATPGRFDQVVWIGLPDERGPADIFEHYLRGLKLHERLEDLSPHGRVAP